ncbi:MAG: glycyl-radical enzyme activating protein [Deltaproteobacteria bacterium]|nr:glycyl-radical enzyme activating protein [Deltaproteobacteria bacterium]
MEPTPKGLIFDIQSFCVHDGPGIRTVVFFKGCNLKCVWCQNPESISMNPELSYSETRCIHCGLCADACSFNAILRTPSIPTFDWKACQTCMACTQVCPSRALRPIGTWMTVDEVMQKTESDRVFFENSGGGITFSGGEPTVQSKFLQALLEEAGRRKFHRALETNGHLPEERFAELISHVELVLFDVKHLDSKRHKNLAGVGNRLIQRNLEQLSRTNRVRWIPRFPLIPGVNDDTTHVKNLGKRLKTLGAREIHILPYHRLGDAKRRELGYPQPDLMKCVSVPSKAEVAEIVKVFEHLGLSTSVGG